MYSDVWRARGSAVAPLAGSVDRNETMLTRFLKMQVAPLAGSVDRNTKMKVSPVSYSVAPLAGSVDRNRVATLLLIKTARRSPRGERG